MSYRFREHSVLGSPLDSKEKYSVVGGGIAGLLMGHHLKKAGVDCKIHEKEHRAGGLISTVKTPFGYFEKAATGFMWSPAIQQLADDLDLDLLPQDTRAKSKYIVRNKKLHRLPLKAGELVKAFWRVMTASKKEFITLRDFSDHYFGKAVSDYVVNPAVGGIFAADSSELSFPGAPARIARLQEKHRMLWMAMANALKTMHNKGHKGTYSFSRGLQDLIRSLERELNDSLHLNSDGLHLLSEKSRPLILTIPAHQAARFFEGHQLGALLHQVIYIPVISVQLFFRKQDIRMGKEGFGCVIPRKEGLNLLGVLFKHDIFPSQVDEEHYSLTCIFRDQNKPETPEWIGKTEEEITGMVLSELDLLFERKGEPVLEIVNKYPKGIPLYSPALHENLFRIDQLLGKDFPHVRLFGNYTGEISLRGMCDAASRACRGLE